MPSRKSKAVPSDDALLDAAVAEQELVKSASSGGAAGSLLLIAAAVFAALIPVYMFCSALWGMSIADDAVVFLAGIGATTFLLFVSMQTAAAKKLAAITETRGQTATSAEEAALEASQQANEAVMYAIAQQSTVFLVGFYFFGFNLLKFYAGEYPTVVYLGSTLITPLMQLMYAQGRL